MKIATKSRSIQAIATVLFLAASASAVPTPDALTGRYYEFDESLINWDAARFDASTQSFSSATGHLVTIGDERENRVVQGLGGSNDKWLGLTDSESVSLIDAFDLSTLGTFEAGDTSSLPLPPPNTAPGVGERGAGFAWITGEPFLYQRWNSGTPSNSIATGGSDAVRMNTAGQWVDEWAGSTLGQNDALRRYVVEFDITLTQNRFQWIERQPAASFNGGNVNVLAQAISLMSLPDGHVDIDVQLEADVYVISHHDLDLGGGFDRITRSPFLSDVVGTNDDDFAIKATAMVEIPEAGDWTFAIMAGDGFRLSIGDNLFSSAGGSMPSGPAKLTRAADGTLTAAPGGSGDTFYFPTAGVYPLELITFEADMFAFIQLLGAQGNLSVFDIDTYRLVGDELNGGIRIVVPEPGTVLIVGLATFLMMRRRP